MRPDMVALLAGLAELGIQLQVQGQRLRYQPLAAMTADLAERSKAHKGELLTMLGGADGRPVIVARLFAARLLGDARGAGELDLAVALRNAWRERMAICEIDGGLTQRHAEQVAASNLKEVLARWQVSARIENDEQDHCHNPKSREGQRQDPIPTLQGKRRVAGAAISPDERRAGAERGESGEVGDGVGTQDSDSSSGRVEG